MEEGLNFGGNCYSLKLHKIPRIIKKLKKETENVQNRHIEDEENTAPGISLDKTLFLQNLNGFNLTEKKKVYLLYFNETWS